MNGKDAYQHDLISTAIIILRLKKIEKLKEEIEKKMKMVCKTCNVEQPAYFFRTSVVNVKYYNTKSVRPVKV
jgi:hypothetical protein